MYPCPPKIPVFFVPDPTQPAGTRPDLKGQKPHANAVLQPVMVRTRPQFLTWPGHGGGDQPVLTAGQRWGGAVAVTSPEVIEEVERLVERDERLSKSLDENNLADLRAARRAGDEAPPRRLLRLQDRLGRTNAGN